MVTQLYSRLHSIFSSNVPLRNIDNPLTHSSGLNTPSVSLSNALNTAMTVCDNNYINSDNVYY